MLRITLILFLLPSLYLTTAAQTPGSSSIAKERSEATTKVSDDSDDESLIERVKNTDLPGTLKLLVNGASPDSTDDNGGLALCWAIRVNNPDIVKALLASGAKVNKEETDGGTPLQVAAASGHADLIKLLLAHGADVNHKDRGGHTALIWATFGATFKSAPDWLKKALLQTEEDEETFKLVGSEHVLVAQLLLSSGADVNAQAEDCGLTPLMVAAMSGDIELAKVLLVHRADVNVKGGEWSALKFAEDFGSAESIQKELADFHDDDAKQAVLNWLHFTASGREEVAKLLRQAGARKDQSRN